MAGAAEVGPGLFEQLRNWKMGPEGCREMMRKDSVQRGEVIFTFVMFCLVCHLVIFERNFIPFPEILLYNLLWTQVTFSFIYLLLLTPGSIF